MNKLFLLCILPLVSACGPTRDATMIRESLEKVSIDPSQQVILKLNYQDDVKFVGQYVTDGNDKQGGNVMYPGDSGAIFLAAIFTHAALAGSAQDEAFIQLQNDANKVLEPYARYLQEFENDELVSSVIKKLDDSLTFRIKKDDVNNTNTSGYILKSEPIFYMSQDQNELVLKHAMFVSRTNQPDKVIHKNIVEIASKRINQVNAFDYWVKQNNLPKVSADMYAKSVDLFFYDMLNYVKDNVKSQKTFHYVQGGKKNYERGSLVQSKCGYTVIRTLRGWLKSFPDDSNASMLKTRGCKNSSYVDNRLLVNFSKLL